MKTELSMAEDIIAHAKKRALKGKGPSLTFGHERNPRKALRMAENFEETKRVVLRLICTKEEVTLPRFLAEKISGVDYWSAFLQVRWVKDNNLVREIFRSLGYRESLNEISNWGFQCFYYLREVGICKSCSETLETRGIESQGNTCQRCSTLTKGNFTRGRVYNGWVYEEERLTVPTGIEVLFFKKGFQPRDHGRKQSAV